MVGRTVAAWISSSEFYSSTRYSRIAGSDTTAAKVLEDANVKIGNVLTDVFGMSGQAMLEALLENKLSAEQMANLAHRRLRPKIPQIVEALEGHRMSDHHRLLIGQALKHMQFIEDMVEELNQEIQKKLQPYQRQIELACTVPGIARHAAAAFSPKSESI